MKKTILKNLTAIATVLAVTTVMSCKEKTEKKSENATPAVEQTTQTTQDQFGAIALYTLRDDIAKDVAVTLSEVAKAGYQNLEAAGYKDVMYYSVSPDEFHHLVVSKLHN